MATEYGTAALSGSVTSEDVADLSVKFHFCYQATESWSLTLSWLITESSLDDVTDRDAVFTYQELGGTLNTTTYEDVDLEDSESITLPASTFCYVTAEVFGTSSSEASSIDADLS